MSAITDLKDELSLSHSVRTEVKLSLLRIEDHPFVRRAHAGRLTKEEGLRWIKCAGRESRTFPKILEQMLGHCQHPKIREILQCNLDDEYGNGNPEHAHYMHYLHLLDKVGVPRSTFEEYPEKAGIRLAVDLALSISANPNLPRALGYMLVNEGMTPITYSAVRAAMLPFFPNLKTTFFDMHISVDEHHVAELYRAVDELPPSAIDDVRFGVMVGERGMAVLLDEVIGLYD
jgi:pyrroloquinoline quinone (PQQ) biosynthesis protein C